MRGAKQRTKLCGRRRLAWVRLETNRATFRHELTVRHWPDGAGQAAGAPVLLGTAHAHGAWVEWFGTQQVSVGEVM